MNPTGRIVGGGLVLIALLWILRIAGALPFSDRTTNQVAAQTPPDRPPIANFDASRTTIANFNPQTGTQNLGPGTSTIGDLANNPSPGTSPSSTGTSTNTTSTGSGTSSVSSTPTGSGTSPSSVTTRPAIRAGW
ncbi:MAG: hypothetical protein MUC48_07890 [Leptolyngbya sp. Prado105]|nr:hypothetical protein [Leptolyngbya sp. Prado105]